MKRIHALIAAAITLALLSGCNATTPVKDDASLTTDSKAAKAAPQAKGIAIGSVIPYAKDAQVPAAVRNECKLESELAEFIDSYADSYDIAVNPTTDNLAKIKQGRVLDMQISNVYGLAGGAWTGAKSVAVKGTLRENGKVIGTFEGSRYSGGGMFGAYKGTCSILGRCVKALGKDIAIWLKAPEMNSQLGDMAMR